MASPPRDPRKPPELASLDDVSELGSLDEAPAPGASPFSLASLDDLQSLDGAEPTVKTAEPTVRMPEPTVPVSEDARFQPPSAQQAGLGLELDVVRPPPAPPPAEEAQRADATEIDPPKLCPEHEQPEPCQACIDLDKPIPGRLLQGALRRQPLVRLGAGLALGLLVGYVASLPYSGRAERRVAIVKAEADKIRYFNAPEMQEETRRLDAQAEQMSNSSALGTIAIWLVIGGGVIAGWYRAT